MSEALPFSVSTTPNFLVSSKLLRIYSILLFRSLILFVIGQQLADGYQSRHGLVAFEINSPGSFHDIWWTINPQLPDERTVEMSQKS